MAQTKRKRQTKHRGNAAGMIESRGRPGSKLSDDARKERDRQAKVAKGGTVKLTAAERRKAALDREPTWTSAALRAGAAALLFFVAMLLIFKRPIGEALALGVLVLAIYIPLSYAVDKFVYNRRMSRKAKGKS